MITSVKRKVLDGLNCRYIYGRVVCLAPFLSPPPFAFSRGLRKASPNAKLPSLTPHPFRSLPASPTHDHFPHRDGCSYSPRGQVQQLLC